MDRIISPIKTILKKQPVTVISATLAVLSMFLVRPDREYLGYVSYHTIGMLFMLMIIMDVFSSFGIFRIIGEKLLSKVRYTRHLALVLIFLCFFFAMFITNDIALLTFVPFTVELLTMAKREEDLIPVIVLQTFAANLGSMLTPIGNPHNLYLFPLTGMSVPAFLWMMLPFGILSAVLLAGAPFVFVKKGRVEEQNSGRTVLEKENRWKALVYLAMFLLCILVVFQALEWWIALIPIVLVTLILKRDILKKVNYSLLLTFICLFVFVGNMRRLDVVYDLVSTRLSGHEFLVSLLTSQLISNVPTSLLLSGMSTEYVPILIGTDFGGLGTLIASMASLISFKLYGDREGSNKGKYILTFSGYSIIFLIFLVGLYVILGHRL